MRSSIELRALPMSECGEQVESCRDGGTKVDIEEPSRRLDAVKLRSGLHTFHSYGAPTLMRYSMEWSMRYSMECSQCSSTYGATHTR